MARTLVDSMAMEWDPTAHHDDYREALMEWIEKRIESGDLERVPDARERDEDAPAPINIMEALKKSLGRAGEGSAKGGKAAKKSGSRRKASKRGKAG